MGMTPAADLQQALELARPMLPADFGAYLIPQGGLVLPVLVQP